MRGECTAKISELTGRNVVAMMSTNDIDPPSRAHEMRGASAGYSLLIGV